MKFLKKKINAHIIIFDILAVRPNENVIHVHDRTGLTWGLYKTTSLSNVLWLLFPGELLEGIERLDILHAKAHWILPNETMGSGCH